MALLTTMEAESLPAIHSNVTMAPTTMASAVTFAVGGFVVAPSVGFAIAILFRGGGDDFRCYHYLRRVTVNSMRRAKSH